MSTFWSTNSVATGLAANISAEADKDARGSNSKIAAVEIKCDRALLVCEALWTILRDKLGVAEEELVKRVNEIDLSDGQLDGRVQKSKARDCPKCTRTVALRFEKCTYCGAAMKG